MTSIGKRIGFLGPGLVILALAGCERTLPPNIVANVDTALAIREDMFAGKGGSDAAAGEAMAEPTGFANLSGVFRLTNAPPALPPLRVSGDDSGICAPGGKMPPNESLVIGEGNALANVFVYLSTDIPTDNSKWIHPDYDAAKDAVLDFDQKECRFLTHGFAMRTTQKLRILNSDPMGHNTNIAPTRGAQPFNQTIPAGGFVMYEPGGQSPDPFPVSCSIHPWMSAKMLTRNNPYFAVTKADGSFTIPNVPAGVDLEFRVWHEVAKMANVTVNGQDPKWKKGKVKLKLEPGVDANWEVVVDAAGL